MRNSAKDEIEMAARREAMLSEGFRLFAEKGIESVSMQEVATACGVGVATLYRYYSTKPTLVIAIGTRQWKDYGEYVHTQREALHAHGMTAAQELDFYLDFYIDLYQKHKDLLRFNQSFNNYILHEGLTGEQIYPYLQSINIFVRMFSELYEKGRRDGTIRTELSKDKMFAATSHIMLSVAVRYAQGLLYSAENVEDMTQEILLVKRMILREFLVA